MDEIDWDLRVVLHINWYPKSPEFYTFWKVYWRRSSSTQLVTCYGKHQGRVVTVIPKRIISEWEVHIISTKLFQIVSIDTKLIWYCAPRVFRFLCETQLSATEEEEEEVELGGGGLYKRDISTQASQGGFNVCVITCKQLHLLLGQGWPSQGVIWNRREGEKIGKCLPSLWHFAICVIITAQLQIFDQLILSMGAF